jgi:hypothetical protein
VPLESISVADGSPCFHLLSSYVADPVGKSIIRCFGPGSILVVWIPYTIEVIREACFAAPICPAEVRFDRDWCFPAIGPHAFTCARIKQITIPKDAEAIGDDCFWVCNDPTFYEHTPFQKDARLRYLLNKAQTEGLKK